MFGDMMGMMGIHSNMGNGMLQPGQMPNYAQSTIIPGSMMGMNRVNQPMMGIQSPVNMMQQQGMPSQGYMPSQQRQQQDDLPTYAPPPPPSSL